MARTNMEALDADVVAHHLTDQLAEAGGRAIRLDGDGEPSLVLVHPHIGLVAVDVDSSDAAVGDQTPFLTLNEKVHTLRRTLRIDAAVPIGRVVLYDNNEIDAPVRGIGGRTSISSKQLVDLSWMDSLTAQPLGDQLEAEILGLLEPAFTFTTTFRSNSSDEGRAERERFRVTLDAKQAAIAQRDDLDVAHIQGPPGSGKTLVLASRARWLSARHPTWQIKLLCYNNALVPYLKSLVEAHPNVEVTTMWPLAQEFGVRFSFESDGANYRSLAEAARFRRPPVADAILIDEVQDFRPSWLAIAYQALAPDRGGLVMAGDSAQSLYGNHDLPAILKERGVEELKLERPYRSTRNILGAIGCLNDEFSIASLDQAPDGEPVELIWANSPVEQAKAISWETQQMLVSGDRKPRDIAVVIPRYKGTLAFICPALEALSIPFKTVITKEDKKTFDRTTDTVKIITPHSAKGHEFPVVFMFGLDTLKAFDPTDVESVNVGRGGFVGATRAKDQLLITYTKHNSYLDILSTDETYVRRWLWPDQYDGVETNG